MNFNADVLPCLQNIEICIHKLKQLGLLNRDQRCPNCQGMSFWTKYSKSKDGWAWKCQTKLCHNYKNYISIRKGSFFANSNIPLPKWLHLMYLWATKASNKQTQLQTGLSNHTIIDAFACLREICGRYLQENPIQLGGPGIIVQVDESQFSHKPKYCWAYQFILPILNYFQLFQSGGGGGFFTWSIFTFRHFWTFETRHYTLIFLEKRR